ncbi:MAG: SPW repeat protein, partial [Xanthobacteraceae bacterium]
MSRPEAVSEPGKILPLTKHAAASVASVKGPNLSSRQIRERKFAAAQVIERQDHDSYSMTAFAAILFFWPCLFNISAGAPRQTASMIGLCVAVLSIAALAAFAVWEEWLNLIAALWLIAAPWLLGFQDSNAIMVDVVIGTIVAVLAAFEI